MSRKSRTRPLIGLLTLLALVGIVVGITGVELPGPRIGPSGADHAPLPGVRAIASTVLLRVGAGAPSGGELAYLAVEPGGNLVVSDAKRHSVMRFDPSGHLLSEWGPTLGDMTIGEPAGVAVQAETFYVLDRGVARIFRLDVAGRLLGTLSLEPFGTYGLNGLAVDGAGNLYIADTGRNRILILSATGQLTHQVGHGGADLGGLTQPWMLAFAPDGSFLVADWENSRIERWSAALEATEAWSTGFHPSGIAVDTLGRVFVPDTERRRLEVYSAQGAPLGEIGVPGSSLPALDVAPKQVAMSRADGLSLYALGGDGIVRVDLENTAPPPQGGTDVDVISLAVMALLASMLIVAVMSRRARRAQPELLGSTPDRPVRLDAEDGTQRQHQQTRADQDFLVTHKTKGKQ